LIQSKTSIGVDAVDHAVEYLWAEQIKRGSTGSMLQEYFIISGTFESETHTNK